MKKYQLRVTKEFTYSHTFETACFSLKSIVAPGVYPVELNKTSGVYVAEVPAFCTESYFENRIGANIVPVVNEFAGKIVTATFGFYYDKKPYSPYPEAVFEEVA